MADAGVKLLVIERAFSLLKTISWVCGLVACAYILKEPIAALAGETTRVAFELKLLADIKVEILVVLTGVTAAWALAERTLRHRKVENMQGHIKTLEQKLDPDRTSSGLTTQGRTNPEDK